MGEAKCLAPPQEVNSLAMEEDQDEEETASESAGGSVESGVPADDE
eukprot:COSAG05_NODE_14485_length_395_cov_1.152027_1_plen_45_part_01